MTGSNSKLSKQLAVPKRRRGNGWQTYRAPPRNGSLYPKYIHFYSIVLFAVVDASYKFLLAVEHVMLVCMLIDTPN